MVTLDVFTKNICITYKTTLLSKAAFISLIFGIVTIVFPFIFAYMSKGFWLKREVFYEQPDVKFKREYIFIATTSNFSQPVIFCSTVHHQKTLELLDTCSGVKVREIDKNYDGKVDELIMNLQINLPHGSQITSIYLLAPLDYKLHVCPLHMQAAIIFQQFLPFPVTKYMVMSDIKISQTSPLTCHKKHIEQVYNYSITEKEHFNDDELINIIEEYAKRNLSTKLKNVYTHFILGKSQDFSFDLTVRYPEDVFYYKPGFWQTIKWAWIQYLSMYIIVSWFIKIVKSYIFNRKLILFYEHNPLKKKQ